MAKNWLALHMGGTYVIGERVPVDIEVIARGLANLARFNGQTTRFYSVAEHSVHCSHLVPERHALAALLHDAAEAYLGDVAGPLRRWLVKQGNRAFEDLSNDVERQIFTHFRLGRKLPDCVVLADRQLLGAEYLTLMPDAPAMSGGRCARAMHQLKRLSRKSWCPSGAERAFLDRYYQITGIEPPEPPTFSLW